MTNHPNSFGSASQKNENASPGFGDGYNDICTTYHNFRSTSDSFGSTFNNIGNGSDNFGSTSNNIGNGSDSFGSTSNNIGNGSDSFGSTSNNFFSPFHRVGSSCNKRRWAQIAQNCRSAGPPRSRKKPLGLKLKAMAAAL